MGDVGWDDRSGPSALSRSKRGLFHQALGRSRGGISTKIHLICDAHGNPLDFVLTGGQAHESETAATLLCGWKAGYVLADSTTVLLVFINQFIPTVSIAGSSTDRTGRQSNEDRCLEVNALGGNRDRVMSFDSCRQWAALWDKWIRQVPRFQRGREGLGGKAELARPR